MQHAPRVVLPGGPAALNHSATAAELRFVPATRAQYLASVFTLWNVLDIHIARAYGLRGGTAQRAVPSTPYGYMREVQLHAYSRLVWRQPRVRTYCEVGFNGGHGTVAMLLASPSLQVHSFELGLFPYTRGAQEAVKAYFGDRFHAHNGDSRATIPAFAAALRKGRGGEGGGESAAEAGERDADGDNGRADVCDVVLIDGDHRAKGVYADVRSFASLARCNATLLIDDLNEGPGEALRKLVSEGVVEVVEEHRYTLPASPETNCVRCLRPGKKGQVPCVNNTRCFPEWGWAIARYAAAAPGEAAKCARTARTRPPAARSL